VKATVRIPAQAPYFDGHFPGRAILPGVVELMLAHAALAREAQRPLALRGIAFARLRQLVGPGDVLDLDARESGPDRLRIELTRAGMAIASAELIAGLPHAPHACRQPPCAAEPMPAMPALVALLPHRLPMRFIRSIAGESARGLDCLASIPGASGLVSDGHAHVLAAVEAAAQGAAAWEALRRWREGNASVENTTPKIGYLVSLREVAFFAEHVPGERCFAASVTLEAAAPPLAHYRFDVSLAGQPLARGFLSTFLAG
jgi:3-hydroxymyristoyl/3-hydroxydecanoyl-(acyl carrier protein) dehydratase